MTTKEIVEQLNFYCSKINCDKTQLPTVTGYYYNPESHLRVNYDNTASLLIQNGPNEEEAIRTYNLDELMKFIFMSITFRMSMNYELINRKENQDFRIILFAKQEELIGILDENWLPELIAKHKFLLAGKQ